MATAIDLFSGCGGLSLGLAQAGFSVLAAVEVEPKAQEVYKKNHKRVKLYGEDIRKIDPLILMQEIGLEKGGLDLLAGCPPCQGFSRLRTRNKATSAYDERNELVTDFSRFVEALLPKMVMMENVPSLSKDEQFYRLRESLVRLGYNLVFDVLDAADYKVAQRRKRLILLASRIHKPLLAEKIKKRLTVRQVISKLEDPSSTKDQLHALPERRSAAVKKIISLIPKDGGSRAELPEDLMLKCHKNNNGFNDVYGRMSWDDVSPTITSGCINPSKGRFLHPELDRAITLREAAMLQGFPKGYRFNVQHGKEAIALMIGNALPPPFIAAHAVKLKEAL